jgi:hypothetical protein
MVLELFALTVILGSLTTQKTVTEIIQPPQLYSPLIEIKEEAQPASSPQVLSATTIVLPSPSPFFSSSPSATPIPTAIIIIPTQKPSPIPTTTPSPTNTATPTSSPTAKPSVTASPTPLSTPTPTVLKTKVTSTELESYFTKYSDQYKIDKELLKRIAKCESGFNPNAKNLSYLGLYQFSESTWSSQRKRMGLNSDITLRTNAEESIKTAAHMIANGGQNAWPNCSH